jgi:nitric oxide reductase subunit B
MQQPIMSTFRWLRVPGDTIFGIGALVLGWFVLGLKTGWSLEKEPGHGVVVPGSTEEVPEGAAHGRA